MCGRSLLLQASWTLLKTLLYGLNSYFLGFCFLSSLIVDCSY